jgi:ABC-type oligopeptide transport system substrate-binding subunit
LTNTEISPLAQKVFSTAADFRKNTFAALNFYELNHHKAPFNDRRVREALSIAIERETLVNAIGETTAQPALSFLPFGPRLQKKIVQDKDRALELLEQAGFPNGRGFAPFRLTVNRNETQLRVARAVAKMWKDNLNIDATLDIRETNELSEIREKGEYDVIRRGAVFPVPDEMACIAAIDDTAGTAALRETEENRLEPANESNSNSANTDTPAARPTASPESRAIQTEAEVIYQSRVIPLYFPMSFSLVKPYVNGFQLNSLDAPDLTELSIDTLWQPQLR